MAEKEITKKTTTAPNTATEFAFTALAAGDDAVIDADYKDERTLIIFLGGAAASTITIKHGNGYAGVNDETFELGASKYMAMTLDSAVFKNVSGEKRGKIIINASTACSIAVVEADV